MPTLKAEPPAFGVNGALQLAGQAADVPLGGAVGDVRVDLGSQSRRINVHA